MFKQIAPLASARTLPTHSPGFDRLWRQQVTRRPAQDVERQFVGEDPNVDALLEGYQRSQKVDAWIPRPSDLAGTSRHAHRSISWGPSPSAWAIHGARIRNVRAENRRTHIGGVIVADDVPASWNSIDELRRRFSDPREATALSHEPPSASHPTGRMWLGPLSRLPGAAIVWRKLKPRQRRIAMAHFAGNQTVREVADHCRVATSTIAGILDVIRAKFVAAGLPVPKTEIAGRVGMAVVSYSTIPINNQ